MEKGEGGGVRIAIRGGSKADTTPIANLFEPILD
jgi:hypothetical protein